MQLVFSEAEASNAEALVRLINCAYRGETSRLGWTTEADLLSGSRTDLTDILDLLGAPDSIILTGRCRQELLACVHLQKTGQQVQFSMLAVAPGRQNQGIGKQLLAAAETKAQQRWAITEFAMWVIDHRPELLSFYQRRGYQLTGDSRTFPVNAALWQAKVSGLRLELLVKKLP
ncbi:GNAT family N-acetyltransferase [Methylomonas paludis]|uniref:GNAT family N-acetyltransferase n=1 Tax=Methylomonas paludis TaxID=1173101 RepID=A0A975MNH7_9GAMM|nr:GNAT family N-acetyltransferase [Methylomonas paludis]QWF70904.1 GNAT family N-acetyltransferase [Methylomonas paludis]